MQQTKYTWGTLIIVILVLSMVSPLPANAHAPDATHVIERGSPALSLQHRKIYPFDLVWALILKHQRAHTSHFSPELIACLMWEESGFRLVENQQSHALGFGQVMPATLRAINKRYNTNLTPRDLLTSPDASVQATVLALELAYSWKKSKVAALVAYAGGFQNYRAVSKWITAEPKMIQARSPKPSGTRFINTHAETQIVDAMHLCSQPGFHPKVLFD